MALTGCAFVALWCDWNERKVRVKVGEQLREIGGRRRRRQAAGGRQAGLAELRRSRGGAEDAGAAGDSEPGAVSGAASAQADADEPAAVCGDAGGAAGDQRDQGPHRGHGLAGAGAARRASRRKWPLRRGSCGRCGARWRSRIAADSFRTLMEQVIEDALTGGFGAIEMEPTGDPERPAMLWPVDGASIRINARWDGQEDTPRYAQAMPGQLESSAVELLRRPADVHPHEPAQLYALRAGAAGGGVRDGESVPERAPLCGQAGGELGGAVCAVAERGHAGAARPADPLVAGRDRGHGARAADFDRAEAGGAALCAGHGCGPAAGSGRSF